MIEWHTDATECLPLLATPRCPTSNCQSLKEWVSANKCEVEARLNSYGAVLFRGFDFRTVEEFQELAAIFCPSFATYVGGNSPRTKVASHVFTATEYPKQARISMHNEASYLKTMPDVVLFYCAKPASEGGQTPLADCRRVLERIDPAVRQRFERRGVRYVTNMHGGRGLGRSWMDVFGTKDRTDVEQRLRADQYVFDWKPNGGLRTRMDAPAIARHPRTSEEAWTNQAEQWHPSSLNPTVRDSLLAILREDDFPHNAYLGDGSPLSDDDLNEIRTAMAAEERVFEWQQGDVLLCDNILVMHGRQPFSGDRHVFVAMG